MQVQVQLATGTLMVSVGGHYPLRVMQNAEIT